MSCVAIIPAHLAEATIAATLESLRLGNAGSVDRVLVVTSANDPAVAIVRAWALRDPAVELVLSRAVRTAGAARNAGRTAAGAGCTHLLFVDADCRLEAGGAARLAFDLVSRNAAASSARVLSSRGGAVARVRHILEFKEAASQRPPPAEWLPPSTTMMCRTDAFDRSGGFPDLWPGEDLVFCQTLRDLGERVERSARVVTMHSHPPGVAEMLRHQLRLGRTAAIARRLRPMKGSGFARSPWPAMLLLPARVLRIAAWQAREGAVALIWTCVLSPLLFAGLAAWTIGFVKGTRISASAPVLREVLAS